MLQLYVLENVYWALVYSMVILVLSEYALSADASIVETEFVYLVHIL